MGSHSSSAGAVGSPRDPVNLAGPEFKANRYPFYARPRDEAPAYRTTLPTKETAWLVTRYDDVATVLKDEEADQPWIRRAFKTLRRNILNVDPPDHTRLRALVHKALMRESPCQAESSRDADLRRWIARAAIPAARTAQVEGSGTGWKAA